MKWWALAWLVAASVIQEPAPTVQVRSGWLRGALSATRTHYQYHGVPYATVDITNRFQAPLPPPKWDGVFDATDESARCPQKIIGSLMLGDPNCLKLNIFTPVRTSDKLLPVMVYIHGGCFFEGTGSGFLYGADYFVERGVVYVGINYRLNIEGFLCLGIKEAPGNAGLKDQIAALRWIRENIQAFGGDPDNVTLFGESAGAVSISYLILSQAVRGLFHKAILQSGSSLAPWGTQHDPIKTASNLVKELGFNTTDPHEIYRILSNKTVSELINAIPYSAHKTYITAEMLFAPCVEDNIPGVEPIVTQYPAHIIQSGNYTKVPMIIGYNDNEGIYFVAKDFGTSLKDIDTKELLQPDLEFHSESDKNETVERIKKFYFTSGKQDMVGDMVNLYSDLHFKIPIVLEAEMYAKTTDQPIYYYLFKYSGYLNLPKMISWCWSMGGASHADELFYMFKPHSFPLPHSFLEQDMIARMVTLWTNFAKYNDPTPSRWRLVPQRWRANHEALVIDGRMRRVPSRAWNHARALLLWNETYTRFRKTNYGFSNLVPPKRFNMEDEFSTSLN